MFTTLPGRRPRPCLALLCLCLIIPLQASDAWPPLERREIRRPLLYSTGLMAVGVPILMLGGAFEAGPSVHHFERAFSSPPEWDDDSPVFNYVLHPLWGSETYLRARESHWGIPGSIAFSLGMSATWEYLFESWMQQPSTQDLIFTTGIGWGLGELRYRLKQRSGERMEWLLDPIHKTLEHVNIAVSRNQKGDLAATLGVSFAF